MKTNGTYTMNGILAVDVRVSTGAAPVELSSESVMVGENTFTVINLSGWNRENTGVALAGCPASEMLEMEVKNHGC